ncbi:MAG: UbiA family prenyltransferase [Paracoccaceae bacterium]
MGERQAAEERRSVTALPLVVDLDHTLCRSDTLHEALLAEIAHRPLSLVPLIAALPQGKTAFKRRLAALSIAEPDTLVYNEVVLDAIRAARAEGREVHLVSASHERQVEAVARHLGLFDGWHGTGEAGGPNLAGEAKARWLVGRFGAGGFDYVGDHATDVPVWAEACRAITVDASDVVRAAAERVAPQAEHLGHPRRPLGPYLKAMRPHQWLKNTLVFLPALAAHDPGALVPALVAFVAFSLVASSVYLINDLLDLPADRAHARKRLRPLASGAVPIAHGVGMAGLLIAVAGTLALAATPPLFALVLAGYFALTLAYSLVLKRRLVIDVVTLAGLYTSRILAGGAATAIALSPWLLALSMFIFLALAVVKRQGEMMDLAGRGASSAKGRAYAVDDLPVLRAMSLASGYCAVLVTTLYIEEAAKDVLYPNPALLWVVPPILLYWISYIVMATHRGRMTDDPIIFAVFDWPSRICGVLVALALVAASGVLG